MGLGKEDRPFPAGCYCAGSPRAGFGLVGGAGGGCSEKILGGKTSVSFFDFLLIFCLLQVFLFLPRKCLLGKHTESMHLLFKMDFRGTQRDVVCSKNRCEHLGRASLTDSGKGGRDRSAGEKTDPTWHQSPPMLQVLPAHAEFLNLSFQLLLRILYDCSLSLPLAYLSPSL